MIEENKIALFDAYRKEELSNSDRVLFEERTEREPLFKLEYEEYLGMVEGIRQFERGRLKQFLMESETAETATKVVQLKARNPFTMVRVMAAAAVLLLLISAFNFFTFENRMVSRHEVDLIGDNIMGESNEDTRTIFYEAVKKKDTNPSLAIEQFKQVKASDTNAFFLAQYEIALLEIKQGDINTAKTTLENILQQNENHFVKPKAKALLEDLDGSKFW